MLVKMRLEEFNALDDEALGAACVEPIIKAYKEIQTRGDNFSTGLFKELSRGQQALFVFRAYYNHAIKSDADFYWWSAYFIAQPERWTGLKSGLRFFGNHTTIHILENMEWILEKRNHPMSLDNFNVSAADLNNDPELKSSVSPLYENLREAVLLTHELIGICIRNNPSDFIQIELD
ncbi:hypothetical protein GK047_00150 [Paenibacillus sp. SYP-B3998]|uniref:Uncharacterized protein n=1 Tax=Paenibacillus sp. SYP-B3998 TaxID=2678564 RepID=A0A6G3ZQN7_9BACL|nr:hypothetical protein [Paenibacillus sp. SYP-B3998]NEW04435.1 hypothetical protein [Paenibacillus sp. SYP-B3998]